LWSTNNSEGRPATCQKTDPRLDLDEAGTGIVIAPLPDAEGLCFALVSRPSDMTDQEATSSWLALPNRSSSARGQSR
jgi:hypothetical protein